MSPWLNIKDFIAQNPELINLVSLASGLIGLVLAYIFYERAKAVKRVAFATRMFRVITEHHSKVAGLEVRLDGQVVPALSVTRMAVWNAGTETLQSVDIPPTDLLRISYPSKTELLRVKILESSRDALEVSMPPDSGGLVGHMIAFRFLDPGDGFLLELTHTSTSVNSIGLAGSVMGGRIIRTAADPEYTTTSSRAGTIETIESYRAQHLSLSRFFLVMTLIAGIVAATSLALGRRELGFAFAFSCALCAVGHFWSKAYARRVYPPLKLRSFDDDI